MGSPSPSKAGDTYGGRRPTSHERFAGRPWDASYADGPAPWDLGAPQPAIARLVDEHAFVGTVLDAGCGTGDNACCIAASGVRVIGFDVAPMAVSIARERAARRCIDVEFVEADALRLAGLGRTFDTVVDCGLFHTFDDVERRAYVAGLAAVTRPGACLYLLCFSDRAPNTGPHPVGQAELQIAFERDGDWRIASIDADLVCSQFAPEGSPAWLAKIERH